MKGRDMRVKLKLAAKGKAAAHGGKAAGAGKQRMHLRRLSLLLLAAQAFLWGCTARELESRRFPLALEVGGREGKLTFACAWPDAGGGTQQEEEESSLGEKENGEKDLGEEEIGENINKDWQVNNDKITRVLAESIGEAVEKVQNLQDKYVDYSQVKAILWDRSLDSESDLGQQVLDWLEKNPVFARNILIFDADGERLNLEQVQMQAGGQPGKYLENLYRNNTDYQRTTRTLEDVLYGDS